MQKNVIQIRRDLHQIPELDKDLPKTISYITQFLSNLRCEIIIPASSSICAYFDFQQVHTLAYRCDMDALPIQEHNTSTYVSTHTGTMHACGHDGHMAMMLQFAKELHALETCQYNVLLIFQPAEETSGGAKAICDSGILHEKHTIAVFGLHLWPNVPAQIIATKSGFLMARSSEIIIRVHGKSSHIATSELGIDALWIATQLLENIYRAFPSKDDFVIKFGYLQSGTAGNCMSGLSILKGSLRTYKQNIHEWILKKIQKIINQFEKEFGCDIQIETTTGYPALYNDERLYSIILRNITIQTLDRSNYLTDDFSYYAQEYPSLYCYLGTGKKIPLHSDIFDFDEDTLSYGVRFYMQLLSLDYKKITA